MASQLLADLPYLSGTRLTSTKQFPLKDLFDLAYGSAPPCGAGPSRSVAALPLPIGGMPGHVKPEQILFWISIGARNRSRTDRAFPVILDTGSTHYLVVSEWHLEHWARSAQYTPASSRIIDLALETVANSNTRIPPTQPVKPTRFVGRPLRDLQQEWQLGQLREWLALIESDLWLAPNERGERDEIAGVATWIRFQTRGVLVRNGASTRPPLLGMRALREGELMLPNGVLAHLQRLEIDFPDSRVHLSYA